MPATIRFRCYHCHRVHTVEEAAAGKRGRCTCGKLMLVPAERRRDGDSADEVLPVAVPPVVETADDLDAPPGAPEVALARSPARPGSGRAVLERGGVGALSPTAAGGKFASQAPRFAAASSPTPLGAAAKRNASAAVRHRGPLDRKGPSTMSGAIYLLLAIPALAGWVFHQFFTGGKSALRIQGPAVDPNYLNLPAALWSTLLLALFLALVLEGIHRLRRARET